MTSRVLMEALGTGEQSSGSSQRDDGGLAQKRHQPAFLGRCFKLKKWPFVYVYLLFSPLWFLKEAIITGNMFIVSRGLKQMEEHLGLWIKIKPPGYLRFRSMFPGFHLGNPCF